MIPKPDTSPPAGVMTAELKAVAAAGGPAAKAVDGLKAKPVATASEAPRRAAVRRRFMTQLSVTRQWSPASTDRTTRWFTANTSLAQIHPPGGHPEVSRKRNRALASQIDRPLTQLGGLTR